MVRIVNLKSENVKRIQAVEIKPDGSLVVVGGKNAQGKSSVLDSIFYACAGGKVIPEKALRDGETKGQVSLELDTGLKITRNFTKLGKTTLKIENAEGAVFKSPQAILDKMCGAISFDPLAFTMLSEKEQARTLRELLNIDFTELDANRQRIFDERTDVNREIKSLRAQYDACERYDDVPVEEVSISDLIIKRDEMNETIRKKNELMHTVDHLADQALRLDEEISDLEVKLTAMKNDLKTKETQVFEAKTRYNNFTGVDEFELEEITDQINNAEETNRKVRANQQSVILTNKLLEKEYEATQMSEEIKVIDTTKKETLAESDFPIDGLSFDEDGVIYNNIPLNQASAAEKLKVSVSISIAMNPELKVILIRDGSLLDDDSMAIIAHMADEHDMQIWIERVGHGDECSVIIEDGMVKE